jgi:hypothetical protein
MNKETEKIINLLGKNDWFDDVFMNVNTDMEDELPYLEDAEDIELPNVEWIYKTTNSYIYFVGVSHDGLIRASADSFDAVLHLKEEFYLIPFYLFEKQYSINLQEQEYSSKKITKALQFNVQYNFRDMFDYLCNLIKYIDWYKEQGYPMYEYIPKLEAFLKEQIELWKEDFEKIKNEE